MRLISCQIENFGRLHDFQTAFQPGLNIFFEENGWGKSTLTAFLTVMFYGFINEHKRKKIENERKRFAPWQKGVYGGQLVFEQQGKKYRLEKTFGSKPSQDTVVLIDALTNLPSADFPNQLGEKLFGIDRESFTRTLYIAQQNCQTDVTPGISAKIGNLADEQADINSYQLVKDNLKQVLNHLTPKRKTGKINQLTIQTAKIKSHLANKSTLLQQATVIRNELQKEKYVKQQLQTKQTVIQQEIRRASQLKDQQLIQNKYQALKDQLTNTKQQLTKIKQQFPAGVPKLTDVQQLQTRHDQLKSLQQLVSQLQFSDQEQTDYHTWHELFSVHELTARQLANQQQQYQTWQNQQQKIDQQQLSQQEQQQLQTDRRYFTQHQLSTDQLQQVEENWQQYQTSLNQIQKVQAKLAAQPQRPVQPTPTKWGLWATLGSILLALISFINHQGMLGMVFLLLAALGGFWFNRQIKRLSNQSNKAKTGALSTQLVQFQKLNQQAAANLQSNLLRLQFDWPLAEVATQLPLVKIRYQQYQKLLQRQQTLQHDPAIFQNQQLLQEIKDFLGLYQLRPAAPAEIPTCLQALNFNWQQARKLNQQVLKLKAAQQQLQTLQAQQQAFLTQYALPLEIDLQGLRDNVLKIQELERTLQRQMVQLKDFQQKNSLPQPLLTNTNQTRSLAALNELFEVNQQQLDDANEHFKTLLDRQTKLQQQLQDLEKLEDQLQQLQAQLQTLTRRYQIVKATDKYLTKAKDNFSARYMQPLKQAFDHYHTLLATDDQHEYQMDSKLKMTAKEAGTRHEIEFLSEGYQDLIGICRRMALIDAMYPNEQPLIIFDDPFVNLDQAKLQGGLKLLQELGRHHQLIYLTCHPSRIPNQKQQN
ncbi:AAA family ATPase [Liquorilactobacillus sicerae]|uniref:AAA family ATPase n=1 Tax=Liquorilactobacillus sicerae TaxID=1416943 RepID=UPI002480D9C7|nr:AAA family ATPase [Liquorilactobacillus sicerae]